MLNVFVYGTLMRGQRYHKNYLSQSEFIGSGEISGFAMYAVSSFPGIVPENGEKVKGEVYQVDQDTLRRLDSLEGEGSLYLRKHVDVLVEGKLLQAWTYVWNQEVKGVPKLDYDVQPWSGANRMTKLPINKGYIWYASYGSNLLKERFMHYIQGGVCRFNGVEYRGCSDKSAPLEDRPCRINHELYFGNRSIIWEGGGVAFLNPTPNEHSDTWGRMFLITAEQFAEVQEREGAWYDLVIDLGEADGIPIKTFTNSKIVTKNDPSQKYIEVTRKGLHEIYPEKSALEIEKYLVENGLYRGEKMLQALHFIRKSPRRCSVFEIMNMVGYKLVKAKRIIEPLVEKGYIRQDSTDTCGEFELSATYYTVPAKRQEIDRILKADTEDKKLSLDRMDFAYAGKDEKALACVSCLTYYKEVTTFCRKCLHDTVELDLKIADVIFELNAKGYLTSYCCAGHSKEKVPYIKFKVDMQEVDVPENFILDRNNILEMNSYHKAKGITKKKMEQTVSEKEYETYWLMNLNNLRSWANKLPIKQL